MKLIRLYQGIGDCIYQRPFVRELIKTGEEIYAETPLPYLFNDIEGLKIVRCPTPWRTQKKALDQTHFPWVPRPTISDKDIINPHYGTDNLSRGTILGCFEQTIGVKLPRGFEFDLPPDLQPHGLDLPENAPVAVIRPSTVRKEWMVTTRPPLPEYINWCSQMLIALGYYVISIADCDGVEEKIFGHPPKAHLHLLNGQLNIYQTLDLIRKADLVVTGSGFVVPAAMAGKTPMFVIFGGRGGFDSPVKIMDHRIVGLNKVGFAVPQNFCRCMEPTHNCDKKIVDLESRFFEFMMRTQNHGTIDDRRTDKPKPLPQSKHQPRRSRSSKDPSTRRK